MREEPWASPPSGLNDDLPIAVSYCTYVDGKHVYSGPYCPHEDQPREQMPGWTVQGSMDDYEAEPDI